MTNLDIALHKYKFVINAKSTTEKKECLTKWEKVERLSIIDIERTISKHIFDGLFEECTTQYFFMVLKHMFMVSDNV